MPPGLALAAVSAFIAWLFASDPKRGNTFSGALWIPLLWLLILGSRPVSLWFPNAQLSTDATQDGSPFDRNVFIALVVAGVLVLAKRRLDWGIFFSRNRWLVIFFLYIGLSVLWSDYPFIAFKRWIKDVGNIVMVLIVLTEPDPKTALRSLLARCAFVLIPLSIVFIKYFPNIGRYLNPWLWTYSYGGVTLDKNMLGATLIACSLGLFWNFCDLRQRRLGTKWQLLLMALSFWLFRYVNSSTAVACTLVGLSLIFCLRIEAVQKRANGLGLYALGILVVVSLANIFFDLGSVLVGALGRDMTLTGRTNIWERVLQVDINPILGVGYYSFWLGNRIDWKAEGWMGQFNEAHNGYIETYLNTGLVGLFLLVMLLVTSIRRAATDLLEGSNYNAFRFAFLIVAIIYNFTEAAFNRLSPIWFLTLLVVIQYPPIPRDLSPEQPLIEPDETREFETSQHYPQAAEVLAR